MIEKLPIEMLRRVCDPESLGCDSSENMEPLDTIIGQDRAVKALEFGLAIKDTGFNIFVAGAPGTGKTTAVKQFLEKFAKDIPVARDWCYVNNFSDSYCPKALPLPPGMAKDFQSDMRNLLEGVRNQIRRAFESEEYAAQLDTTVKSLRKKREELFEKVNEKAKLEGFSIQQSPLGLLTVPMKEDGPLSDDEFNALEPDQKDEIIQKRDKLQEELKATIRQAREIEKEINEAVQKVDRDVTLYAIGHLIDDLREKYHDLSEILAYLEDVKNDILDNLAQFRADPSKQNPPSPLGFPGQGEPSQAKYEVDVLVDNSNQQGGAVVIELNPTYNNLFGRIEKEAQFGALVTDFTMIKEGSLHRANGGYLVLPADEVLRNQFSWDSLKRALRNKEIIIEEAGEKYGFVAVKTLRPEPIPLNVKVVLIGTPYLYHMLYEYDEDFTELFKVKADFDTTMDRDEENLKSYLRFVCGICSEDENLKHLDKTALAKLVEHGSRLADDQDKLSTRFGELSDVIMEASFYASHNGADLVNASHVMKAIEERHFRSNLPEEKIGESINRGTLKIDVEGERVGQVNGLAVFGLGDVSFGKPSRITVSVGPGRGGVMDIEREAKLGGPLHTKGVLILSGYLVEKYAHDKTLSLSARLVFEQSYAGVDGDSASSTELYCILSSLSGLPIKQSIAVTGSVNQKGEVQAIGGVNEKIEGFFEVCKAKGLNGRHGVMIPESNVKHLMLKEEVVEAVQAGKFSVWPVKTVDEGIEMLTGVRAGELKDDGEFEEGTVNNLVDKKLRDLADKLKKLGSKENNEEEKS